MQLTSRNYIATTGVTQRPLLVLEQVPTKDGNNGTFVAEPHDQRSKITGQVFNFEEHPSRILTDPAPPSDHMRTYRTLLADQATATATATATVCPLSIHQDLPSIVHFSNHHRQFGRSPCLYRLSETDEGWTLSKPFNLFCRTTFELVDRYDPDTRQGYPTISPPDDTPWAIVLPKSKTVRVEGVLCEQFVGRRSIRIEGATTKSLFTIMVRDSLTKEPLSLHNTTESVLFHGQRHAQGGRTLELVNGDWDTFSL